MMKNVSKYNSCAVVVCPACGRSVHIHRIDGEMRYNVHLMQRVTIVERESAIGSNANVNLSNTNCFMSGRMVESWKTQ